MIPWRGMRNACMPRALIALAAFGLLAAPPARARPETSFASALREKTGGKLAAIYAGRNWAPFWFTGNRIGPAAATFLDQLDTALADGLDPGDYDPEALQDALAEARSGNPQALAQAELRLTRAFARYAADMRIAEDVGMQWLDKTLEPDRPRPEEMLRAAALRPSFADYVANMGWMSPHYVIQRKRMIRALDADAPRETLARLRLNLERARVLPGPWVHHIVVDAASGRLWFYQAGAEKGTMKVVVGKPKSPTPMLAGMLQYAILNPYWNIPTDLAQKDIAPKILRGRTLKSLQMEALSDWSDNPTRLKPAEINWKAVAAGKEEIRLRQLPGPTNAMGRVKFMFPNDSGIYLHDTPDRALFAQANRHFSNGCIRLEDAETLGTWLLGHPLRAEGSTPEQALALTVPIPVYLTYFTATDTKRGVGFIADVYGRDGVKALALADGWD